MSLLKRRIVVVCGLFTVSSCGDARLAPVSEFNVSPAGGSVAFAGGLVRLTVPPGAVSSNILVTASPATDAPASALLTSGSSWSFSPGNMTFSKPVTVTVNVSALTLPAGVRGRELRLHRANGSSWELVPGSAVAVDGSTVTANVMQLSTLGLLALPVTSILIATPRDSIAVGGTMQVVAVARSATADTLPDRPVTWTSGAPGIAAVSTSGMVTGIAPGRAGITATSGAVTVTDSITVVAPPPPVVPGVPAAQVFTDGFESGDFSQRQNGVSWVGTSWMDVTTTVARTGSRSARFRQGDSREWSELRFGGLPRLPEVFLQFYLYMPSGAEQPSLGPRVRVLGSRNDKFFRLWGTDDAMYAAAPGNKVGASLWGNGTDGSVGQEYEYTPDTGPQWGMGEGLNPVPRVPFVTDANRGRWVRIRIHCKVSGPDNRSGVIQMWADNTLLITSTRLQTYPPGGSPNSYTHGYLLGWANNGFQPGQYMYVDDVSITATAFPP